MYGTLERLTDMPLQESEIVASAAFTAAMDDDLNTAKAVAVLMEAVTLANRSSAAAERKRCKAELLAGNLASCSRILSPGPRAPPAAAWTTRPSTPWSHNGWRHAPPKTGSGPISSATNWSRSVYRSWMVPTAPNGGVSE